MRTIPKIFNNALPEISGFASSRLKPNHLWAINDSGNSATIFRIGENLRIKQSVKLNVQNRDWEDLASFYDGKESWIIVADTGDNKRQYEYYFLYFYKEAKLISAGENSLTPDRIIKFSYINGSQNCEAVAIDPIRKEVILINKKKKKPPTAYRLPLDNLKTSIANKITKLSHFSKRNQVTRLAKKLTGVNFDSVTAMDISSNGEIAMVLTYKDIWMYRRPTDGDWSTTFRREPINVVRHTLAQAESISIHSTKPIVAASSEKLPAPLIKIDFEHLIQEQ